MSNLVKYKEELLSKNSEAYKLLDEKKFNELDLHLEKLRKEAIKRGEIRKDIDVTFKIGGV